MMPGDIAIFSSLLVALLATFGTVVIHGFVVHTIVMTLRRNLQRGLLGMRIWLNLSFIMGATLLAFAGHLLEIALWAFVLKSFWRGRRRQRGLLFIGGQLHDVGFRHRIAAAMEAARTI